MVVNRGVFKGEIKSVIMVVNRGVFKGVIRGVMSGVIRV